MELFCGVNLLVDILLRLEVDGREGRLRRSVSFQDANLDTSVAPFSLPGIKEPRADIRSLEWRGRCLVLVCAEVVA